MVGRVNTAPLSCAIGFTTEHWNFDVWDDGFHVLLHKTITEWFRVVGTSGVHLVQPLYSSKDTQSRLPSSTYRHLLKVSNDGDSTISLGIYVPSMPHYKFKPCFSLPTSGMQHPYYFISVVILSFLITGIYLLSPTTSLNACVLGLNRYLWWQSWQRVVEPELWQPCTLTFWVCRNWMSWTVSHTSLVCLAQHGKANICKVFVGVFYKCCREVIQRVRVVRHLLEPC